MSRSGRRPAATVGGSIFSHQNRGDEVFSGKVDTLAGTLSTTGLISTRDREVMRFENWMLDAVPSAWKAGKPVSAEIDTISKLPDGIHKEDSRYAVCMCDPDHFKRVCDEQGHDAGDRVLREFSGRMELLIRDDLMRRLVPEDPIAPLFDHVRHLFRDHGVSTVIVTGGGSSYLAVADTVIGMREYRPTVMTEKVPALPLPAIRHFAES